MLELLTDMPDGVIGVKAVGTIDAADYRAVMAPAVEALAASGGKVNMVYLVGDEFDRYTVGAVD